MNRTSAALLLAILLPGCFGATPEERARASAIAALPADAEVGQALYLEHCAVCHGEAGQGASGPDLRDMSALDADEVVLLLMWGPGEMPSFEGWSDAELADVTAWVREGI
ncbi:MAG: cytochrome c [Alphaproteobacteria bacterium]|nr:cytochrome c [Alphaproteobacteria bacterium]MCB9793428.1 cytochrome c [Alphaproteobacteria bacterium]